MKPGALTWMFAALGLLLARPAHATDTVYYYSSDTIHSEVVVTDANRNVVERTTHYAPYGQVLNRDLRDGPGYGGHEEDPETSLVYMQQRYYDPEAGRFLSTDPVQADGGGGSFNRYEYANDNPYRYTDPDGRAALWVKEPDGSITLIIPVHFTGSGATHSNVMGIALKDDTLNVGGAKVAIDVVSTSKPIGGVLNKMDFSPGLNTKMCGSAGECVNKLGGDSAHINSAGKQSIGAAAHDVLHFAGIKDQYVEGPRNAQGNRTSKPTPGYDNSNIMTSRGGTNLKPQQLQEANHNSTTKHCTRVGGEQSCT